MKKARPLPGLSHGTYRVWKKFPIMFMVRKWICVPGQRRAWQREVPFCKENWRLLMRARAWRQDPGTPSCLMCERGAPHPRTRASSHFKSCKYPGVNTTTFTHFVGGNVFWRKLSAESRRAGHWWDFLRIDKKNDNPGQRTNPRCGITLQKYSLENGPGPLVFQPMGTLGVRAHSANRSSAFLPSRVWPS